MSERDCGKWYCQPAAGYRRMVIGKDVLVFPGDPVSSTDVRALDRERKEVNSWFKEMRAKWGPTMWLAGPGHGNGNAHHYWVWDPDSRERYMEFKIFDPGTVDVEWGSLHRGRGWQLPLLAVFEDEPRPSDLIPLKAENIPFVVLSEAPLPDPDSDDEDDEDDDDMENTIDYWAREYYALDQIPNRNVRVEKKLDIVFLMTLEILEGQS